MKDTLRFMILGWLLGTYVLLLITRSQVRQLQRQLDRLAEPSPQVEVER